MPRLTDPWFRALFISDVDEYGSFHHGKVTTRAEAQGIMLWCPCGYGKPEFPLDGGRPHAVIVPFRGIVVPENFGPLSTGNLTGPRPRWDASGTDLNDLTVIPSIAVGSPECWHGWIRNGEVIL